jgi:hypothetical protein
MNHRLLTAILLGLLCCAHVTLAQQPARSRYKPVTTGAEKLLNNIGGTYDMSKDPHRYIVFLVLDQQGNKHSSFWAGINAGGTVEFAATHDVLDDTISIVQKGEFSLRLTNSARKFGMYHQLPAGTWATTLRDQEFRISFEQLIDAKIIGTREGKSTLGHEGTLIAVEATCVGTIHAGATKAPFRGTVILEFSNKIFTFSLQSTFPLPGNALGLEGANGENIVATLYTGSTASIAKPRVEESGKHSLDELQRSVTP